MLNVVILHGQHTWRYQPTFVVVHAVLGSNINDDFHAANLKQLDLHAASRGQHRDHMYLAVDKI